MENQYKNKCILVRVGLTAEIKPYKIINPKINIDYNNKTIKLDYWAGEVLFNGLELWRDYKIKSNDKNIIFGFVNSIGDRLNYWAKENHYIAIDKKNKKILGLLKREMGWGGSFGQKYSDWKSEILESYKEVIKPKMKQTEQQKEQDKAEILKTLNSLLERHKVKDWVKVLEGRDKKNKGHYKAITFIYEDNSVRKYLLRKKEYKVYCEVLGLEEIISRKLNIHRTIKNETKE